jgi:23S rRNA (adenine2030-N6)-methyltransferase
VHYRHAFHAGNFADVFKHVLLLGILEVLSRKDAAWCFFDTHAGAGRYDLSDAAASRTGEWREGVGRVWAQEASDGWLGRYRECLAQLNPDGRLRWCPGSPLVAASLRRPQDRLVLCEAQPQVASELRRALPAGVAAVHCRDGYELPALLPPVERRGVVLIDPPFERPDEFEMLGATLERALPRFPGATFLLWYPVKNRHTADRFARRAARGREVLRLQLRTGARGEGQMRACGVLVVRAPYGCDVAREMEPLAALLGQGPTAGLEIDNVGAGGER